MFDTIGDMELAEVARYLNEVDPKVVPNKPQGRVPAIARLVLDETGSYEMWPCTALRWTDDQVMVTIQFTPGESASARPLWLAIDDVARVLRQDAVASDRHPHEKGSRDGGPG
jgi:hypothetical protein